MTNRLYVNEPAAPSGTTDQPSATPSATAFTATAEGTAPDAKRPTFAEGTQPAPKLEAESLARGSQSAIMSPAPAAEPVKPVAPEPPTARVPADLAARAMQIGEVWSHEYVRDLRAQHRDIVGGWPGTLREARRRVLAAMPRTLDPHYLEDLAKITNLAARKGWETVSEPDLEP
jgi:hypothetical protein